MKQHSTSQDGQESGRMASRVEHGSGLSVERAFVVHLGTAGGGRRRFAGRVEHLPSGRSARFSSLKGLLAFFSSAPALSAPAGFDPQAGAPNIAAPRPRRAESAIERGPPIRAPAGR